MKKIVVTGGSGFIGSNLVKFLLKKDYFVINIDKLSYSANPYNLKKITSNKNYRFFKQDINNKSGILRILNKFKKNGVNRDKIVFMERLKNYEDHLKAYNNIDISLDTFPFAGATTTFESLWMGVPTITLSGEIFNSKFGVSINKNLNLNNFIAKDKTDYIEKAKIISSDINKLSKIRQSLRNLAINSRLFDNKDLGLELSKILKDKWNLFFKENKNL